MKACLLLFLLMVSCGTVREFRLQRGDEKAPITVSLGPAVVSGGLFFVYLPDVEAHTVSVAGSFNGWRPAEFFLTNTSGSPLWSGFLPLTHRESVQFCYFINGRLRRADPVLGSTTDEDGQVYSTIVVKPVTNG